MASASAVAMVTPTVSRNRPLSALTTSDAFVNPMRLPPKAAALPSRPAGSLKVRASSMIEKAIGGLTAAAVAAALVIPDVAEAAQPGISPSLKNFLLSIVAGGVVLGVIIGAVIAVANFDPVRRS